MFCYWKADKQHLREIFRFPDTESLKWSRRGGWGGNLLAEVKEIDLLACGLAVNGRNWLRG